MNENGKRGKSWNLVMVITVVLAIGLVLSSVGYGMVLSDKNNLKEKYERVKENYDTVNSSYNSLQLNYNLLNKKYNSLQTNHTNLKQNYTSLQSNYSSLSSQYTSLQESYSTLQSSYAAIQSQYNSLQSNYNSLQSQYNSLQSDYNALNSQYTSLNNNYNSLQNNFTSYKQIVEVRYGWGENATRFVTPNDPDVVGQMESIISSDDMLSSLDIHKMNQWVYDNIEYNSDTNTWPKDASMYYDMYRGGFYGEFWQYPNETLEHMWGDCEDNAVLLLSLCKAEENIGNIWCAEVEFGYQLTIGHAFHACVLVDEGDNISIYDPTWGWEIYNVAKQDALDAYLDEYNSQLWWEEYHISINRIFNEEENIEFNSNQEFFNFF